MISILQKILLFIFLGFSCVMGLTLHTFAADCNPTDIARQSDLNSPCFNVSLSKMDPLGGENEANRANPPSGVESFHELITSITDILLFMIPIFAAISLLIAGYLYIFSAGDSEKAGRAKTIIKWNIVAILVAFLSYGIVSLVASFF